MKSITKAIALLSIFCICTANQVFSQATAAKLLVSLGTPRPAGNGLVSVDVLIKAGTGYVTNSAEYYGGNPNGSWETVNLRFTATGTTAFTLNWPVAGISGPPVTIVRAGGCYSGAPAYGLLIKRLSPAADAGSASMVVATITYTVGGSLSIRNTTTADCAIRESFWNNSNTANLGERLAISAQ